MSRITHEDAASVDILSPLFTLQDDGDSEVIRILCDSWGEVPVYLAHSVRYQGLYKYWDCGRSTTKSPESDCPMCMHEGASKRKYFIPIYNYTQGRFQYWFRGPAFLRTFTKLADELYPLSDVILEVERVGTRGSSDTRYEFTDITDRYINSHTGDEDINYTFNDFDLGDPDSEEAGIFIKKDIDEIEFYIENGVFEDDETNYQDRENSNNVRGGRGNNRSADNRGGRFQSRGRDSENSYSNRSSGGSYSSRRTDYNGGSGYTSRANGGVRRREF